MINFSFGKTEVSVSKHLCAPKTSYIQCFHWVY